MHVRNWKMLIPFQFCTGDRSGKRPGSSSLLRFQEKFRGSNVCLTDSGSKMFVINFLFCCPHALYRINVVVYVMIISWKGDLNICSFSSNERTLTFKSQGHLSGFLHFNNGCESKRYWCWAQFSNLNTDHRELEGFFCLVWLPSWQLFKRMMKTPMKSLLSIIAASTVSFIDLSWFLEQIAFCWQRKLQPVESQGWITAGFSSLISNLLCDCLTKGPSVP